MNPEAIAKVLETAAKYAWVIFVLTAFVLFAPTSVANQLGLVAIKDAYSGYLWLLMLFAGAIAIGTYSKVVMRLIWRFFLCPIKKLALPVTDFRTGIKQSRMRY